MDQPVAIVTGAGRGIGRATAQELARRGYALTIASRTHQDLEETRRLIGGEALLVLADVSRPADARTIVQRTMERFRRIDALINNAGFAPVLTIEEIDPGKWRQIIETNLSSIFYLCREVWPVFRNQGGGVIVNLSSFSSRDPFMGLGAYGAAKAGVNLLGMALAREGAAIGVRVHTIAPAAVETAMFRQIMTEEQFPPEKTLDPADVARVVGQCIAGDLQHTSGEVIYLNQTA